MKQQMLNGFRKLEKAVLFVNGVLLVAIIVLIVVQVVARKIGISVSGTEELARFSYIVYTFLAWPIACLYGSNIAITMFLDKCPAKVRLVAQVLFQVAMTAFSAMATYSSFLQVKNQMGVQAPSNDWFQMHWLYSVVFVCLILCTIFSALRAIFLLTGDMVYVTQDEINEQILREQEELDALEAQKELEAQREKEENA